MKQEVEIDKSSLFMRDVKFTAKIDFLIGHFSTTRKITEIEYKTENHGK